MTTQNKVNVVNRYIEEVWNKGNVDAVDELLAEDYTHLTPPPGLKPTREGFKKYVAMMQDAFPDLNLTVEETIVDGDKVVQRYKSKGTHRGELMGISPTGNTAQIDGISIYTVKDGKIVDDATQVDFAGLLAQIGAVSMPNGS